ncbi:DNA repair protein RecO [Terrilactibacillus sp. S3-3]|nr:DNA repair protein RecO [Terrilactibacillus sp. S3-3]
MAAASQVLFHGQFMFKKGRGLGSLYQAAQIESFRGIKQDISKTAYAALIVEMVDRLAEEGHPSSGLYHLLIETLLAMDKGLDAEVLSAIFEVKMMAVAGIEAQLDGCLRCGSSEGPFHFSINGGGFLCKRCCGTDLYAIRLSHAAERLLPLLNILTSRESATFILRKKRSRKSARC